MSECQVSANTTVVKSGLQRRVLRHRYSASARTPRLMQHRGIHPTPGHRCGLYSGGNMLIHQPGRTRDQSTWSTHGSREGRRGW